MGKGILIGCLLHFFQLVIMAIMFAIAANMPGKSGESLGYSAIAAPFVAGATQILYMLPAILIYRSKGRPDIAKGILIVAAITLLLNASCFGLMWLGSRK